MCGIVGYIGNKQALPILIEGLKKLEYRGYDSAGIAVIQDGTARVEKTVGRLSNLEVKVNGGVSEGHIGIGHTRWATHGRPSDANSHPHTDEEGRFVVIHNGIIENYLQLKEVLQQHGHIFQSETDTEVVPHLIESYYEGDIVEAVRKVAKVLRGAYALGVMCQQEPDKIVAEAKRVLKPGGMFVATLSNRYFPPKVIKLWTQLHPMERMAWVGTLIRQAGFRKVETYVERGLKRPKDDRYADRLAEADPLFATWGVKP